MTEEKKEKPQMNTDNTVMVKEIEGKKKVPLDFALFYCVFGVNPWQRVYKPE